MVTRTRLAIANVLAANLRRRCWRAGAARSFLALMPYCPLEAARYHGRAHPAPPSRRRRWTWLQAPIALTMSFGVTGCGTEDLHTAIARADKARLKQNAGHASRKAWRKARAESRPEKLG